MWGGHGLGMEKIQRQQWSSSLNQKNSKTFLLKSLPGVITAGRHIAEIRAEALFPCGTLVGLSEQGGGRAGRQSLSRKSDH